MDNRLVEMIRPYARGCESLVDLGAMIGEYSAAFRLDVPDRTCVEVFRPYIEHSVDRGATWCCENIATWLGQIKHRVDLVMMIDVLEHLDKTSARVSLLHAKDAARKSVVVFTPLGFYEQSAQHSLDAVSKVEKYKSISVLNPYQEHRSGWTEKDLQDLGFHTTVVPIGQDDHPSIFATWQRPEPEEEGSDEGGQTDTDVGRAP